MRNFGTVVLLIWWKWAGYNSRRIMGTTVPKRIMSSFCRVFCVSVCFGDRSRCHRWVTRSGIKRIPSALRVQSRAQHKEPSYNR
jgi:hypothetical protein